MNDSSLLRTVVVWGIPFAVVVAALGYETDWGRGVAPDQPLPRASAPKPVPVALLPEYGIGGGVDARRETVERTLFNPTRRAAPPAVQSASASPGIQHGQYTLTGTTVNGNVATAFLRDVKGGKSHTVRQGQALNGVTVAEVKPDYVKLTQGSDVEELRLKIASGPKATIQPAAAVPTTPAPVPPTAANAAVPGAAVQPGAPATSVAELLAQRRRAAREAAAGGSGASPAPPATTGVVPPAPPPAAPSQAVQKAAGGNADWARVYQGMGQVRH